MQLGTYRRRQNCRVCHSSNLIEFLDYGNLPLAGGFLLPEQLPQDRLYPLDLSFCGDCSLVQVANVVDAEILFTDYRYLSSITATLIGHFEDYARTLRGLLRSAEGDLVVEFGSNDGVLLRPLNALGVRAVGVDAAANVVEIARGRGCTVIQGFFGDQIAQRIIAEHGHATIVTASNVFAHIDDLDSVMRGVDQVLAPDGTFAVEVHYLLDLLKTFQWDTVYHEHLCYYSLHALQALYARFGFMVADVTRLPMHGGAIRVFAKRISQGVTPSAAVTELLAEEVAAGLLEKATYRAFGAAVPAHRDRLAQFVGARLEQGRTMSAYGAAGRATILLNYCGFDASMIRYVVDESPSRCGRYVPGVHIPIVSRKEFADHPTDDCLITAWNYAAEVVGKEAPYTARGGRFLIPFPDIGEVAR